MKTILIKYRLVSDNFFCKNLIQTFILTCIGYTLTKTFINLFVRN